MVYVTYNVHRCRYTTVYGSEQYKWVKEWVLVFLTRLIPIEVTSTTVWPPAALYSFNSSIAWSTLSSKRLSFTLYLMCGVEETSCIMEHCSMWGLNYRLKTEPKHILSNWVMIVKFWKLKRVSRETHSYTQTHTYIHTQHITTHNTSHIIIHRYVHNVQDNNRHRRY